jgi:hypothetical protein
MTTEEDTRKFNEIVKSLVKLLEPEQAHLQRLKDSPENSGEREAEILEARSKGLGGSLAGQEMTSQQINNYNSKVEGIAMTLQASSRVYGIHTFITRRFKAEYTV